MLADCCAIVRFRKGRVQFDGWHFTSRLVDLPTVIESQKTIDSKTFYKTADICQILICKVFWRSAPQTAFPLSQPSEIVLYLEPVLRIRGIFGTDPVRGSVSKTHGFGSGSCYFCH